MGNFGGCGDLHHQQVCRRVCDTELPERIGDLKMSEKYDHIRGEKCLAHIVRRTEGEHNLRMNIARLETAVQVVIGCAEDCREKVCP